VVLDFWKDGVYFTGLWVCRYCHDTKFCGCRAVVQKKKTHRFLQHLVYQFMSPKNSQHQGNRDGDMNMWDFFDT
jgi:hypothetical protein